MEKNKNLLQTKFSFKAKRWRYEGPTGWCFITIPKSTAKRIRATNKTYEEGWGRLKTTVSIGKSKWKNSIWFDAKADSYLLPIKLEVRKKESLIFGKVLHGFLDFDIDPWMIRKN